MCRSTCSGLPRIATSIAMTCAISTETATYAEGPGVPGREEGATQGHRTGDRYGGAEAGRALHQPFGAEHQEGQHEADDRDGIGGQTAEGFDIHDAVPFKGVQRPRAASVKRPPSARTRSVKSEVSA